MSNTPFKIREVKPKIFLFEFTNYYDMCMYFLRYQEFYESPSPKFRGKSFEIFDFMKWYTLKYGKGAFTYPRDWDGFNIPGDTIKKVWDLGIADRNLYDYEMMNAWNKCKEAAAGDFYIIGVVRGNKALSHEIAHGFFYLYPEYKKQMTKLVKSLDPKFRATLNSNLKKLGYTPKVYIDESQAYLSTSIKGSFGGPEGKIFKSTFKSFLKKVK